MSDKLKWRFDASTFKLLGRGLITDRITAIYELVKNCYDADATSVQIEFHNVGARNAKSQIIIRDNGQGMSLDDIRNKWLVVGTSSKRKSLFTPKFKRRYIGEKGVGRFATDKLGEHLRIRTKQEKDSEILEVTINWKEYERELSASSQMLLFTDLENEYRYISDDGVFLDGSGTELSITLIHEAWGEDMLMRLQNQLTRVLSPINKTIPSFNINFYASEFDILEEPLRPVPLEELATVDVLIPLGEGENENKQGVLKFDEEKQIFEVVYKDPEIFGLISMQLYYFNTEAQKNFKSKYKGTEHYIEGIKIYRDGVICTPFAEYESSVDTRRDILGIDKRRHTEAWDKISSRDVIGIVDITNERNPNIIDSTNRQDFNDTPEYRRLKEFIIEQLDELVKYKFVKRQEQREITQNNLKRANADVKDIEVTLKRIVREKPELKELLAPTIKQAENAANFVKEGVREKENEQLEFTRKENLYLSLMSMQDFANDLAHGIRFVLTPVKHAAEIFADNYPNPNYDSIFKRYPSLIYKGTNQISQLVDFMLSYSQIEIEDTVFSIKELLENTLNGAYEIVFEREHITVEIDIAENIELTGKRKFLEDVLSNLISNSIKALKARENRVIKCESYIDGDFLNILFSDNGVGVHDSIKDKLFEMFKTTTFEEGGAGLGLYIARKRMEALGGTIDLDSSIYTPVGATFKMSIPLKK